MHARILAALICLASGSPALAWDWCSATETPPAPNPHPTVDYRVLDVSNEDLNWVCEAQDTPVGWIGGCASDFFGQDSWTIYLRNDLDSAERQCVLEHELAHLPPVLWDHGPIVPHYVDSAGVYHLKSGPRYRRAVHIKPWHFVSGRVGGKLREQAARQ